jgi:mono/diheme cytochrome c family protein
MNRSSHVPARWKTPLKASLAALIAAVGLSRLARPAGAADAAGSVTSVSAVAASDAKKIDFVKDVAPIFKTSCVKCHSVDPTKPKKKPAAGFRLDDKAAAFKGGRSGKALIAGNAKDSLLFKLLSGPVERPDKDEDDKEIDPMPKVKRGEKWKPLSDDQIATLKQWIDQGANWPD